MHFIVVSMLLIGVSLLVICSTMVSFSCIDVESNSIFCCRSRICCSQLYLKKANFPSVVCSATLQSGCRCPFNPHLKHRASETKFLSGVFWNCPFGRNGGLRLNGDFCGTNPGLELSKALISSLAELIIWSGRSCRNPSFIAVSSSKMIAFIFLNCGQSLVLWRPFPHIPQASTACLACWWWCAGL